MSTFRSQAPARSLKTAEDDMDKDYDYKASKESSPKNEVDGEEALLDLAQLEELHQEAEKMKALGNKHMAAQEYTRAYNAYSAALQLSPVGPSSHVFLSNRAAALLSLKRYSAAATDARRAVALAPTFGKAHARLGQALYFLKDYAGAVAAYQDALYYEPDNPVTQTYLDKAKGKLERKKNRGVEENSTVITDSSTQMTSLGNLSIATDHNKANVVTGGYRASNSILKQAAGAKSPSYQQQQLALEGIDDPDFEEAVRIQQRANKYLSNKQYKAAIEEYTAALFLVPDDPNLSPDLHLGRAHALNGSRRHERARNDAQLAIRLNATPAAYSTLAKSLFYMKDYRGSVDAFSSCMKLLPPGESLGMFDKAYLQKAEAALEEEEASLKKAGTIAPKTPKSPVPRLPPPRFVPREEAINSTSNVPPMPKQWPQQSPRTASSLKVGPEREIVFLSEGLGIKLNRGSDGVVRVLSVTPNTPASPVARNGKIEVGDVVREAAGVDIRRPITNIMWGDTVALVKMAPRPITLIVAKELSPLPPAVLEEQKKTFHDNGVLRPSPASGNESVKDLTQQHAEPTVLATAASDGGGGNEEEEALDGSEDVVVTNEEESTVKEECVQTIPVKDDMPSLLDAQDADETGAAEIEVVCDAESKVSEVVVSESGGSMVDTDEPEGVSVDAVQEKEVIPEETGTKEGKSEPSLRDKEESIVGGEILFDKNSAQVYGGWDNLRWMSYSGARKVRYCQPVFRLVQAEKKNMLWSTVEKKYVKRVLVIYEEPNLMLILRRPSSAKEVHQLLGLPDVVEMEGSEKSLQNYWVVESVVDPAASKLRLSPLTTATSLAPEGADGRRRSCFELASPTESIVLSAVRLRHVVKKGDRPFSDSGAFLETVATETAITKALCVAHDHGDTLGALDKDITWKHQIILGTLHSHALSGNQKALEQAIQESKLRTKEDESVDSNRLPKRIVDALDENGRTPLYYACASRMSAAVGALVNAGASIDFRMTPDNMTFCHLCAQNLDDQSLSTILSATHPSRPDPNALDALGRTPMYVAVTKGRTKDGCRDAAALGRCIASLEAWGGQMMVADELKTLRHPVSVLAAEWCHEELAIVLDHLPFRYPIRTGNSLSDTPVAVSLGAFFHFPVHSALIAWRNGIISAVQAEGSVVRGLVPILAVLFEHGFEPNERLEGLKDKFEGDQEFVDFVGFAPMQILALAALDLDARKGEMNDSLYSVLRSMVAKAGEFLVKNGARLALDVPPGKRLRRKLSSESSAEDVDSLCGDSSVIDRSALKLDTNRNALALLGGEDKLNQWRKEWSELGPVNATAVMSLSKDDKTPIPDTDAVGGSNEKSCAICWKTFGSIVNRKHRCRVSWRHVCDDCSSKRVVEDGKEYRVSDGQFLLASADAAKEETQRAVAKAEQERIKGLQAQKTLAAVRQERLEAEERSNRDSLFGGILEQATNYVMGAEEQEDGKPSEQVQGLTASLGETRNALLERGQKLSSVEEKSSQMVDASADFARMAKELRKKSERGLFW